MKIIFAGTPDFAAVALKHLIDAGHEIALVLSQPDRPSGRGMKLTPSPVKKLALEHGIPVITPVTLSLKKAPEESARIHADLKAVVTGTKARVEAKMDGLRVAAPTCSSWPHTASFFRRLFSTAPRASAATATSAPSTSTAAFCPAGAAPRPLRAPSSPEMRKAASCS